MLMFVYRWSIQWTIFLNWRSSFRASKINTTTNKRPHNRIHSIIDESATFWENHSLDYVQASLLQFKFISKHISDTISNQDVLVNWFDDKRYCKDTCQGGSKSQNSVLSIPPLWHAIFRGKSPQQQWNIHIKL